MINYNEHLKQFILENSALIDTFQFDELYKKWISIYASFETYMLTQLLLNAGINPLDYMTTVPKKMYHTIPIKTVYIPSRITSIGYEAFEGCDSLTSITISDSVTSIGFNAFGYCSSLTSINYNGTTYQWENIKKSRYWKIHSCIKMIKCIDGELSVDE